jgi:hypothetical protein
LQEQQQLVRQPHPSALQCLLLLLLLLQMVWLSCWVSRFVLKPQRQQQQQEPLWHCSRNAMQLFSHEAAASCMPNT